MLKIKLKLFYCLIASYLFFSLSCAFFSSNKDTSKTDNQGTPVTISTIKWITDNNGYLQFYTNDSTKITSSKGATYWKAKLYSNITNNTFYSEVNKISGSESYGYGVIFGIQDDPSGNDFNPNNFYALLVRTDGYYSIIKMVKTDADPAVAPKQYILPINGSSSGGWVYTNLLNNGKNQINKIKIISTDTNGNDVPVFTIYFNDYVTAVYSFQDATTGTAEDGTASALPSFLLSKSLNKYGFVITLSPNEDFPVTPVNVLFKQLTN